MREILFRGKSADNGEWVEGSLITFADNTGAAILKSKSKAYMPKNDTTFCTTSCFEVIPETIGQFTGLTDRNGNKIFEGDIVKTHYANAPKSDFIETVVFHNGKFCAFHENNGCKQWAILYDGTPHLRIDKSVYMNSVEVIGNIHDNPEWLKGGGG